MNWEAYERAKRDRDDAAVRCTGFLLALVQMRLLDEPLQRAAEYQTAKYTSAIDAMDALLAAERDTGAEEAAS